MVGGVQDTSEGSGRGVYKGWREGDGSGHTYSNRQEKGIISID